MNVAELFEVVKFALEHGDKYQPGSKVRNRALSALEDLQEFVARAEARCPVCAANDWGEEYDYMDGGDELRIDRCQVCGWPPPGPVTVEEHRRKHFVSPYLRDLEAALATAVEGQAAAEQRAADAEKALREVGHAVAADREKGREIAARLHEWLDKPGPPVVLLWKAIHALDPKDSPATDPYQGREADAVRVV